MIANNLIGSRFGRWLVVGQATIARRATTWLCRCDCGAERNVGAFQLLRGLSKSCGCLRIEAQTTHGHARKRNRTPEYMAWYAMWQRCTNANNKQFRDYGQRGISVDARWRVFANFIEDMGERPEGSTIERVDNEKGYGPDNCKWATRKEQQRNRRVNHILEFNGQRRCLTEWAELLGLRPETIHSRIRAGWDLTRILSTPTMGKREVGLARWGKLTVA